MQPYMYTVCSQLSSPIVIAAVLVLVVGTGALVTSGEPNIEENTDPVQSDWWHVQAKAQQIEIIIVNLINTSNLLNNSLFMHRGKFFTYHASTKQQQS